MSLPPVWQFIAFIRQVLPPGQLDDSSVSPRVVVPLLPRASFQRAPTSPYSSASWWKSWISDFHRRIWSHPLLALPWGRIVMSHHTARLLPPSEQSRSSVMTWMYGRGRPCLEARAGFQPRSSTKSTSLSMRHAIERGWCESRDNAGHRSGRTWASTGSPRLRSALNPRSRDPSCVWSPQRWTRLVPIRHPGSPDAPFLLSHAQKRVLFAPKSP